MTDDELNLIIQRAQRGEKDAFGLVYDAFSEKIYKFIYFRVGHREIAEDILSDTFVKAWSKLNQVSGSKTFSAWVYQIAKHNIIDYYRLKKTTVDLEDVSDVLVDLANPIDELNLQLEQKRILSILDQLSTEQQQVIKYRFFEDLSNEEIAQIMNKSEGAIRVLQHRAIIRLKQLLQGKK
jgi:RNA polymerase sigma-70 factor, ECF subfamily